MENYVLLIDFIKYVGISLDKAYDLLYHHRLHTQKIDNNIWVEKSEINYFNNYYDKYPMRRYTMEYIISDLD